MRKGICALLALCLLLTAAACAPKQYTPAGEPTGNEALDTAVLALLQERCGAKKSEKENIEAVFDFIAHDITYRPGTADTSGGFPPELTNSLALELLQKRKGNCDSQAALMAVLLRRMGYDAQIVQGTFTREEGTEPVDHAWVYAVVNGTGCYFDPLYGGSFAEHAEDYCMASGALLEQTHQWDADALN